MEAIVRISQLSLSGLERKHRMNIRNAYLAETAQDIRVEAMNRAAQVKWFEAALLLELALDD